jgi:hypothetical protein
MIFDYRPSEKWLLLAKGLAGRFYRQSKMKSKIKSTMEFAMRSTLRSTIEFVMARNQQGY